MAITRKAPKDDAPAEQTPAQELGQTPPAPAETTPEIDPGPLSFSDAQEVITSRGAGAASEKTTVFDDVIKDSYKTETVKEFTVPTAAAKTQITALRSAANRLHVGVRIRHAEKDGRTTIQFLARDKQWRGPRTKSSDDTAQTDAPAADTAAGTDSPSGDA